MWENVPFKSEGAYVLRRNPKNFENFNETKFKRIWNIALGGRDESYYLIISFSKDIELLENGNESIGYKVFFETMSGEILDLVDYFKNRSNVFSEFQVKNIQNETFKFGNDSESYEGYIEGDFLMLLLRNNKWLKLRYIPGI